MVYSTPTQRRTSDLSAELLDAVRSIDVAFFHCEIAMMIMMMMMLTMASAEVMKCERRTVLLIDSVSLSSASFHLSRVSRSTLTQAVCRQ